MNIAMAQSLSFFGNRRGSTKSHTYQVNGGQQITKDRVDEVKNPRTTAQMVHRCCLHTLSDAHAWLKKYVGQFWGGAGAPAASLAAFRKANYPIVREAAESNNLRFEFCPYKQTMKPIGRYILAPASKLSTLQSLTRRNGSQSRQSYTLGITVVNGALLGDYLSSLKLLPGDIVYFLFHARRLADNQPISVFMKMQLSSDPNLVLDRTNPALACKFSYYSDDPNVVPTLFSPYLVAFDIRLSSSYLDRLTIFNGYFYQRKVNGKLVCSPTRWYDSIDVQKEYRFQNAIATYPQGGGNVLDGGTI